MLPDSLVGSYRRYKADTSIFATWLEETAVACGYQATKPSFRKAHVQVDGASEEQVHVVPVKTLIEQADLIAQHIESTLHCPRFVVRAATRAIEARRRFTNHFAAIGLSEASDAAHRHFLDVLERALDLVKPVDNVRLKTYASTNASTNASTTSSDPITEDEASTLANRFDMLEVEDTLDLSSDTMENATDIEPKAEAVQVEVQEDEDTSLQESMVKQMMVYHFFQDLENVREFLKETWEQYKARTLDLRAATIITNAAISLVQHAEAEVAEACGADEERSYLDLVTILIPGLAGFSNGADETTRTINPKGLVTEIGLFTHLSVFHTLHTIQASVANTPIAQRANMAICARHFNSWLKTWDIDPLTQPMCHMMEVENEALVHYLADLVVHETILHGPTHWLGASLQLLDELSLALLAVKTPLAVKSMQIAAYSVFAGRILLDINGLLSDQSIRPFLELKIAAAKCVDRFGPLNGDPDAEPKVLAIPGMDETLATVRTIPSFITDYKLLVPSPRLIRDAFDTLNHKESLVHPSDQYEVIFKKNAAFCGTMKLKLDMLMEAVGIHLANHHLSILSCAYLFLALRNRGLLHGQWPELEAAVRLHGRALFVGSIPSTADEISSRFGRRIGISITARSKAHRADLDPWDPNMKVAHTDLRPGCLKLSEVSLLLNKYFENDETMVRTAYGIHAHIVKQLDADQQANRQTSRSATKAVSFVELLVHLRDHIPAMIKPIDFDYMHLTEECKSFLDMLVASPDITGNKASLTHDAFSVAEDDPIRLTISILSQDAAKFAFENNRSRANRNARFKEVWRLEVAGKIMERFLGQTEARQKLSRQKTANARKNQALTPMERTGRSIMKDLMKPGGILSDTWDGEV